MGFFSKTTHVLDGVSFASGSETTVKSHLRESAQNPKEIFKDGNADVFANITHWKGEMVQVKEESTRPIGIVTNLILIQSKPKIIFSMTQS